MCRVTLDRHTSPQIPPDRSQYRVRGAEKAGNAAKNIFIEGQEVGRDAPPKPVEKRTATFSMRGRDPRRKGKSFSVKQVAKVSGGLV